MLEADEDKGAVTYVFHVHLDRWVHRGPCILDNSHPPGFCVGKEGRRRLKSRDLAAPF
jgi:hypothetical protein